MNKAVFLVERSISLLTIRRKIHDFSVHLVKLFEEEVLVIHLRCNVFLREDGKEVSPVLLTVFPRAVETDETSQFSFQAVDAVFEVFGEGVVSY